MLTDKRIVKLYVEQKHTLTQIAYEDGRSFTTIRSILLAHGVEMRRKGPNNTGSSINPTHLKWARDIDDGDTYEDVARRYGVTKQAVHIAVKRLKEREDA